MAIYLYKTSTPSTLNGAVTSQVKSNPQNNFIYRQHHCGKGRNSRGIITVRHIRGGHKCIYYIYGRIVTIEYNPNQNAYICLLHYGDGERFILHPRGAIIRDTIVSARSASSVEKLTAKEGKLATLKLPSGEVRLMSRNCSATVEHVGNVGVNQKSLGRAETKCWLSKRPIVRGVVMNPVDHPHGSGEGRAPIGRKKKT
ncbi:hypothetical protein N665_0067s0036 [Sinapis alba]|nr:hypothetical protein N665_0067s0036 [Sinapis alba]